jgi:hypothetical protein
VTGGVRMGGIVLVAWGALLMIWTAVQAPFGPTTPEVALLGGAGVACFTSGWVLGFVERRRAHHVAPGLQPGERLRVTDLSMATVTLALGIATLGVGAELGHWMQWIGGGGIVIGFAGLIREALAERRA